MFFCNHHFLLDFLSSKNEYGEDVDPERRATIFKTHKNNGDGCEDDKNVMLQMLFC